MSSQVFIVIAIYSKSGGHDIHSETLIKEKKTTFLCKEHHNQCFECLIVEISQELTFTYFGTNWMPILQMQSNLKGVGAALMLNDKPIA